MFVKVPIIGTGTAQDPYRPKLPAGVPYTCVIPSRPDGLPNFSSCLVALPDDVATPADATKYLDADAISELRGLDSRLAIDKLTVRGTKRSALPVTPRLLPTTV